MPLSAALVSSIYTRAAPASKALRAPMGGRTAFRTGVMSDDYSLASGMRAADSRVHDRRIRFTVDRRMNVVSAKACAD